MRLPLLSTLLLLALLPVKSVAMWAGIPDSQLVKQSTLIVKATYVGATNIITGNYKGHLGVLDIEDTLKGRQQGVVFILLNPSSNNLPQRGDEIKFRKGQKGIWFLESKPQQQGIYLIKHPQQFIPESKFKDRLPTLFKLID